MGFPIKEENSTDSALAMRVLLEKLSKNELLSIRELIDDLVEEKQPNAREIISLPVEIFSQGLNVVEAVTKYLKENLRRTNSEIAQLLEKKENTVWLNYKRARTKKKERFSTKGSSVEIPLEKLVSDKLNMVESLVKYLREEKHFSNKDTAKLVGTSDVVVSTAYNRMRAKLGR